LAALITAYRASDEFRDLAQLTRKDYGRVLSAIEGAFGQYSADVSRQSCSKCADHFAGTEAKPTARRANKAVAVLSALAWGRDHGYVKENDALRLARLKTGPGYATWTESQFWQFMDCLKIGEPMKRAAALAWFTGLRVQDCIKVPKIGRAREGGSRRRRRAQGRH
jgi:integrase